jgi:hypothetical protein
MTGARAIADPARRLARTLLWDGVAAPPFDSGAAFQTQCDAGWCANARVDIQASRGSFPMKMIRTMAILGAVAATACGGPSTSPSSTGAQTAASSYQALGQDMATTVAQYQAATATMPDLAACQAVEAGYEARIGPMIDRMMTASAAMDQYMAGEMGPAAADMACVAAAMAAELDRHRAVACAAPDVTVDRTEATRHAQTMAGWIDHQRVRYEQMGAAIGMTPPTTDTTWTCTINADGSFTMNGQTWTPPQTPPSTTTPTPSPDPWPMPCGGWDCPCDGYPGDPSSAGTTSGGTTPGGWGMPGGPMM